jgi:hypothetical protein
MPVYPDISDILARKAKGRRELAARSFGEKLEILEAMRARVEPIRRARAARVSSSEALVAQNRDDLRRLFQVLGVQVGPRHGPNRRTNEQKEWYCLRRYLLALAANGLLHYPVKIYKSESPDFVVCDSVRGIFGVEVTTATEQDWERELSRSDAANGSNAAAFVAIEKDGFVGDDPERNWSTAVIDAIERKLPKFTNGGLKVGLCDLLIYMNSRASVVANAKTAAAILLAAVALKARAWADCSRLGRIHVLTEDQLVYDLLGEPRIFKTN